MIVSFTELKSTGEEMILKEKMMSLVMAALELRPRVVSCFLDCCCCSAAEFCLTLCDPIDCSTPAFPVLYYLLELAQTHVDYAIKPSHPLLPPSPPALSLSQHQGLFHWVGSLHQVARVLVLPLQHQSFQWLFRTISFRIDWFDLLAVQGTLKSHLQHHDLKASILQHSAFFMFQLSHLYMTTGKTIALTVQTFFGKVMTLLLNMLFRFVIAFLSRSKRLFISWLQSPSSMILESKKIKSATVAIFPTSVCREVMRLDH